MRKLIFAAALAIAGAAASGSAQALPAAPGLLPAGDSAVQNVALVCRPVWNGWRWVDQCVRTAPRYYRPRAYYAPPPRFYGPRPVYRARPVYGHRHYY